MIQDIKPYIFDNNFKIENPTFSDIVLCYSDEGILLDNSGEKLRLPLFMETGLKKEDAEYLFCIDRVRFFLADQKKIKDIERYVYKPLRFLNGFQPKWHAFAGLTGSQLYRFQESRQFCGKCGSKMEKGKTERSYICTSCGYTEYPKISPAVIVAVVDENRLLMTKYANGDYDKYALVAGFVEVGETFEQAVKREVLEETGIHVKDIHYYKNQPWALTDSQMIGYFARLSGDDHITIQESELKEATWFEQQDIPVYESNFSIGQELIEAVRTGTFKQYMK